MPLNVAFKAKTPKKVLPVCSISSPSRCKVVFTYALCRSCDFFREKNFKYTLKSFSFNLLIIKYISATPRQAFQLKVKPLYRNGISALSKISLIKGLAEAFGGSYILVLSTSSPALPLKAQFSPLYFLISYSFPSPHLFFG